MISLENECNSRVLFICVIGLFTVFNVKSQTQNSEPDFFYVTELGLDSDPLYTRIFPRHPGAPAYFPFSAVLMLDGNSEIGTKGQSLLLDLLKPFD